MDFSAFESKAGPTKRSRVILRYINGYLPEEADHLDKNRLNSGPSNFRRSNTFWKFIAKLGQSPVRRFKATIISNVVRSTSWQVKSLSWANLVRSLATPVSIGIHVYVFYGSWESSFRFCCVRFPVNIIIIFLYNF